MRAFPFELVEAMWRLPLECACDELKMLTALTVDLIFPHLDFLVATLGN